MGKPIPMSRERALELLLNRETGLREWNLFRECQGEPPSLQGAFLRGAELREAQLWDMDFRGADLSGATLVSAECRGSNFEGANLRNANLTEAYLRSASFLGADLSDSRLVYARFIGCDMTGAILDGANVKYAQFEDLLGLPNPPSHLRLADTGEDGRVVPAHEAMDLIVRLASVEVCLDRALTDVELGSFRFHLGELRARGIAVDVAIIGERIDQRGTVLRFQARRREAIWQALPALLAPFRMSKAVDRQKTLEGNRSRPVEFALTGGACGGHCRA